jgi:hypothetical protein
LLDVPEMQFLRLCPGFDQTVPRMLARPLTCFDGCDGFRNSVFEATNQNNKDHTQQQPSREHPHLRRGYLFHVVQA